MNDTDVVSAIRALLIEKLGAERCALWFGANTRMILSGDTLVVEAATKFAQDWLRSHYRGQLESASSEAAGKPTNVEFRIDGSLAGPKRHRSADRGHTAAVAHSGVGHDAGASSSGGGTAVLERPVAKPASHAHHGTSAAGFVGAKGLQVVSDHRALVSAASGHHSASESTPRRRFATLDKFVVGSGNQLSIASAQMVAERPGSLTPLMFFGPTGCGKTHLLEGIWSSARSKHRGANVVYLSAEQFTTYFVEALRGSGLPNFRRKYRGVDLLMIDDLQFLVGKRATLVELLHTIDALLREGRQMAFTADRAPADLSELGPELTTRLAGGMVCRLESPDLQMRCALVRQFGERLQIELSDEVAQSIASQVTAGTRELAGAVNRVHAASRMLKRPISLALAEEALAELLRHNTKAVRLGDIEKAVCGVFGLSGESLQSSQRTKNVSTPRMLAMWLARKYTRAGLAEIGQFFGRRSHSTVISANKRVTDWMAGQSEIELADRRCQVDEVIRRVEEQLRTG